MSSHTFKNMFASYPDLTKEDKDTQFQYWKQEYPLDINIKQQCMNDYISNGFDPFIIAKEKVFIYDHTMLQRMLKVPSYVTESISKLSNPDWIDIKDFHLYIITYHGLGNGAGWATKYKDKPAILLGVEKIVELNWDDQRTIDNLIYHEYIHLIHEHIRGNLEPFDDHRKWINQLYVEGFATYYETFLTKQKRRDSWYQDCKEKESDLKQEFLKRINNQESCQEFFGDWYKLFGLSDTGYYLGSEYIHFLTKSKTANQIATMNDKEIKDTVVLFLKGVK